MQPPTRIGYKCSSCNKEYGPLPTTSWLASCKKCDTLYPTEVKAVGEKIELVDSKCKKCKGKMEIFMKDCPKCGKKMESRI